MCCTVVVFCHLLVLLVNFVSLILLARVHLLLTLVVTCSHTMYVVNLK